MSKNATDFASELQANLSQGVEKMTSLHLETAQKAFDLQMGLLRSYTEVALGQAKALSTVKEPKDVMELLQGQVAQLQSMSEKGAVELAEMAKLNAAYGQDLQSLIQELTGKAMPTAA